MSFADAQSAVVAIAERLAQSSGLEVVEVEVRGGSGKGGRIVRVFIERNAEGRRQLADQLASAETKLPSNVSIDQLAGVTHEDLESFSRELSTHLDVEDVIPGSAYTLEVSSPGLDRKLYRPDDYRRFSGSLLKISTREPVNGNRHWQGRIKSVGDDDFVLSLEQSKKNKKGAPPASPELTLPFRNIEKAQLVPEL
ncbi:MAG: ribosome maturation factor RimP [Acidobacteriales bacterium]|nr:ribosome maturation factor RimP [Terriglobales bacterium]